MAARRVGLAGEGERLSLQLSDKTFSRQCANQFAHFESQQGGRELSNRKLRRFRQRINLKRRVGRKQLENRALMLS